MNREERFVEGERERQCVYMCRERFYKNSKKIERFFGLKLSFLVEYDQMYTYA